MCRGRYLPVEVIRVDNHGKGIRLGLVLGIHLHSNVLVTELEFSPLDTEVLCCAYKLQESLHRKREWIEEVDLKLFEARGGVPMKNCTQVSSSTLERKTLKVRKRDGRHDRRMHELLFYVTVGNGVTKTKTRVSSCGIDDNHWSRVFE